MTTIKKADEAKTMKELCQQVAAGKKPVLTEAQKVILARYYHVLDRIKTIRRDQPDLKVFEIRGAIKKELCETFGISLFQASIDYVNALEYFEAGTTIATKELNLKVALQQNEELIERALEKNDLLAVALFEKNKVQLLKLQSDVPVIDWYAIPFPTIRFAFNPSLLKGGYKKSLAELYEEIEAVETALNIDSRNYKDSSLLSLFDATDIDYEEINDEEEGGDE